MFFAPEMFQRIHDKEIKIRGEQTDLWALGVTFFFLMCGRFPCQDALNASHLKELICEREINFDLVKVPEARALLKRMLNKNPEERATLEDLENNLWLSVDGKEVVSAKTVEVFKDGEQGFGNIGRAI
jgi:serine/threonine protein kinase